MPEGPAKLVDEVVETAWFGLSRLETFAGELSGRKAKSLETRGKAQLIHFEHGLSLYSHNQLYGCR